MSNKSCFSGPFNRQHGKWVETLLQSEGHTFTIYFNHCKGNYVGKSLFLVIYKIGKPCVNILFVDDKHYVLNRDNFSEAIQMQLSRKEKSFSELFVAFLKSILNFKHLPKKMTLTAVIFLEIPAPKNMVRLMSNKLCFTGPFNRKHSKWVKTLLQSERQHFYNIY